MTALLRCRGSLSEISEMFDAHVTESIEWTPTIWPGEAVIVVRDRDGMRHIEAMPWALPPSAFIEPPKRPAQRATLFPRMLAKNGGRLAAPERLQRCLIVAEAFAYPTGEPGQQRRAWAGLWDKPLFGWAALWSASPAGAGCAGLLVPATPTLSRVSNIMPLILQKADYARWLDGRAGLLSLSPRPADEDIYLEESDEAWSTGSAAQQNDS